MNIVYSCVIIEDSLIERDLLLSHLTKLPYIEIKAVFEDGLKALNFLSENTIDIVISDIEMPYIKGIELIKVLKTSPAFILTTSYSTFAVEGFELNAVDYIVKPVTFSRIEKAIKKALKSFSKRDDANTEDLSGLLYPEENHFYIKENSYITKLFHANVLYIESLSDFSKIYMVNNKVHVVLANLKSIEAQLPVHLFKRVHRQFIINIQKICSIATNEIVLDEDKKIPLGNTYKKALMDSVNDKIISRS